MNNLERTIGNTPIVEIPYTITKLVIVDQHNKESQKNIIENLRKKLNKHSKVYAKCEWFNLSGSIKDRVAYQMITDALNSGELLPNQEIVEVTSGNMGIALAVVGTQLGHKVTIFMPKGMSSERVKLLRLSGANLILAEDFKDAFIKSEEYAKKNDAFLTRQFDNISNIRAHYYGTGEEIAQSIKLNRLKDNSSVYDEELYPIIGFVSGVGSGGTLTGIAKRLRVRDEYNESIRIIAIDPYSSSLLTSGSSKGHHKLQGLSDEVIPKNYDESIVDELIEITDDDAIAMTQKLNKSGYPVGISGGANFLGAVLSSSNIVYTVFADDNKKYLSTDLSVIIHTPLVDAIEI